MEIQDTSSDVNEGNETRESSGSMMEKTGRLKEKAGSQVKSMMAERKGQLTEKLNALAGALRNASGQLRNQESGKFIAGFVDNFSDKIERASSFLNERDIDELMNTGKTVIRQRPVLALAGVFAAGFICARLLKSTGRPAMAGWRKSGGTHA